MILFVFMVASLVPGTLLADTYQVVRLVGAGGMGEVYEATHARLAGRYAVKVLLAEISNRPDVFQRFRREAEVTSGLRHPNIVQVIDFNQTPDGHPYLVMEYIDGIELAAEIQRVGAMPLGRVLDIVGQAASALTAAHSHKIVHRDLKPQNMFLMRLPGEDRQVVKIVDFGISKVREATTRLTQETTIMGTPQYMAPEQALGKVGDIDERTDEFALAAITYELLTGRTPFNAESTPAVLYQVVHEQPEPIRQIVTTIDPAVESVVFKALSKAQSERYPTVPAFHRDLVRAAGSGHAIPAIEISEAARSVPGVSAAEKPTTLRGATTELESRSGLTSRHVGRSIRAGILGVMALAGLVAAILWLRGASDSAGPVARVAPPDAVAGRQEKPAPAPAARFDSSIVEVEDAPPGLQVTVDGVLKELPVVLPAGPEMHALLFEAVGYEPREIRVDGARERRSLVLSMKRLEMRKSEPSAKKNPLDRRILGGRARPVGLNSPNRIQAVPPENSGTTAEPAKAPEKKARIITDF